MLIDDVNKEIVYKYYFNIGVVIDIDCGLLVLNIKYVEGKGLFVIVKEIIDNM